MLDVPVDVSLRRRSRRAQQDRIEARSADYHSRVREGYLTAASAEPRAAVLDGAGPFEVVQEQLRGKLRQLTKRAPL